MSNVIDQRVVEMRFDNRHFESNVSTTMSTLDKLKKSLKFDGATEGLENIEKAANKCDISSLGSNVEKVGLKFNVLYTIADQAFRNITNSAMAAGKKIVSALTIDPVKTGFSEYETQINAIQTILANTESKGTTLEDVNGALDELNTYADKTIYNFTEMTRNIGTFTAAGVDLDTSVSAIKGIANLAAVSGSTSQQASTAMYQLSQAMASGTVKLMDWNSVVNAGMGGQVFQNALKETAKVHGIAIDDIIAKNGSFRESLSEGWLTTEILTDTLAKFTGDLSKEQLKSMGYTEKQIEEIMKLGQTANDAATKVKTFTQLFDTLKEAAQSGWTQTWEILVGDFEEAKELLTSISDTIGKLIGDAAESRNELLENWKVLGGREDLLESFKNIWEALISVIEPIKEAFREIFPPTTAEQLVEVTKNFKEFTAKLKLSEKGAKNLKRTFKGIFAVFKLAGTIISAVVKAIGKLFDGVRHLGGAFLSITAVIGDFLSFFFELATYGNIFEKVFNGIATVINFLIKCFATLVSWIADVFDFLGNGVVFPGLVILVEGLGNLIDNFIGAENAAVSFGDIVSRAFSKVAEVIANNPIFKFLSKLWELIKTVGKAIGKFLSATFDGLISKLEEGDFAGILEIINGIIAGGVGVALMNLINSFKSMFDNISDLGASVSELLGSISGSFRAFQNSLNAEALKKLAVAIAILSASILVLSLIDKEKLSESVAAITLLMSVMMGGMAVLTKTMSAVSGIGGFKVNGLTMTLIGFAIAVSLLASALVKIGSLNIDQVIVGLVGLALTIGILIGAVAAFGALSKVFNFGQMNSISASLILLGIALTTLIVPLTILAHFSWPMLAKAGLALAGFVAAVALLGLISKYVNPFELITLSASMVVFAIALQKLMIPLAAFALFSWPMLAKAGLAIAGLIGAIALLSLISKIDDLKPGAINAIAASMIVLAVALQVLTPPLTVLAHFSWEMLGRAGASLAGLVAAVALLSLISKYVKPGTINALAASMIVFGIALKVLMIPLTTVAHFSWDMLKKAGVALAGLVGALSLISEASTWVNPLAVLEICASLGLLAISLGLLVIPLSAIQLLNWSSIAKGALVIAGAFATLIAVGWIVDKLKLDTVILKVCASLALFSLSLGLIGIGLGLVGIGLAAFSAGLTAFGSALVAFAWVLVESITIVLEKLVEIVSRVIIAICKAISASASAIGEAAVSVLKTLLNVILECVPAIVGTVLALISELLRQLNDFAPDIADSLFGFLLIVLEKLSDYAVALIDLVIDIIIKVIDGVAARASDLVNSLVGLASALFGAFKVALSNVDPKALLAAVVSVGIMAVLVGVLSKMSLNIKDVGKAAAALVVVGVLLIEVSLILAGLGALSGLVPAISKSGDLMLALSISLLKGLPIFAAVTAIALFAKTLTKATALDVLKAVGNLGIAIGAILVLFVLLSGLSHIPGLVEAMHGAGDVLVGIYSALEPLVSAIDLSVIAKVGLIIAGVGGLVKVISKLKIANIKARTMGKALLNIVIIFGAIMVIVAVFATAAALIPNINEITANASTLLNNVAGMLINLIPSIALVVGLLMIVDKMQFEWGSIAKTLAVIGVIFVAVAALAGLMIGIGAAINAITSNGATVINNIDLAQQVFEASSKALISMLPLFAVIALFAAVSKIVTVDRMKSAGTTIAGVMALVAELVLCMAVIGGIANGIDAIGGSGAFISSLNVLPQMFAATSQALISAIPLFKALALFGVVGALIDFKDFTNTAKSIGIVMALVAELVLCMAAIGGLISVVDNCFGDGSMLGSLNLVQQVFAATSQALLSGIPMFAAIAIFAVAANAINPLVGPALIAIPAVTLLVAELIACMAVLGKLIEVADSHFGDGTIVSLINTVGDVFEALGSAFGKLIGGFIASVSESIFSTLSSIGTHLSNFMINLKPFIEGAKSIDSSIIESVASLAAAILIITATSIVEGLTSWFTGGDSISKFAAELVILGNGLKGFSDAVNGINPEAVTAAANAGKTLAEMTNIIPNSGGVVSWFTGENSISKFAAEIVILGHGLKGFSNAVNGINPEAVTAAANAGKALTEMTNSIPNSGGVVSWFTGDNSISKFAVELVVLGHGLKGFSDAINGINYEAVSTAANAASSLAEMTNSIPNSGGVVSWITGDNSISKFAVELVMLGHGLKGFSNAIIGINPEAMSAAANAASSLAEMTTHIPKEGGIKAWFTGETNVANFANKLPTLGKGLKGFSDSVKGINPENATAASSAAKTLAQMTETVPKDTSKIITFGENLVKFGDKLASYFNKTKNITKSSASASKEVVDAVKQAATVDSGKLTAVSTGLDKVTKSLMNLSKVPNDCASSFIQALKEIGEKSSDAFVKSFDDLGSDLKKEAKSAMDDFAEGIEDKKKSAKEACTSVVSACATAISDKASSFYDAGKALVKGFVAGIDENTYLAKAQAKAMAEAAEEAAKKALDINSPSKVFKGIGSGIPEGFAMGIDSLGNVVKGSVESMSTDSIDGVKRSISRIADLVNSDIDAQPTIRPVLDLSNVRSGANSINGLFKNGPSVSLAGDISAINSIMTQKNQNGANADVVSAIDNLNKNLKNGGDTYNFGNISYDDESTISEAVQALVRAVLIERRV